MKIQLGSTYHLNRTLYSENRPPVLKGELCRVIGMAVYTDVNPQEEITTIEFENGVTISTYFADMYLESVK